MLLPIGHEQTTVRRMPWATLTIIGLCVVAFILTAIAPSDEPRIANRERRALQYFFAHPYLELDPALKGYAYYSLRPRLDRKVPPPADEDEIQRQQQELNALVAAVAEARQDTPYFRWGLVPARPRPTAWLTHMMMHAGFLHLFANLFILYLVGPPLEDVWGRPLFVALYVAAGLVAALFFVARFPDLDEPLIGASGAISGVMGAFAVRFWNTRITFFYWLFFIKIYTGTFSAPAWLMLGLWAAGQVASASGLWAVTGLTDMGNIAFGAHVAGFVFGLVAALVVRKLAIEERYIDPSIERRRVVHEAQSVEEALDLARRGRTDLAMARLEGELDRHPRDPDFASALWNVAVASGAGTRAAPRMTVALEAAARAGDEGLPALCWGEVLRTTPEIEISTATAVRLAEMVLAAGLTADAEETLRWLEHRVDETTPVGQLVRLARVADRIGVQARYAELALARPELPAVVADELREIISRSRG